MTTEDIEKLFLSKYGNKITASESWVIRFAEECVKMVASTEANNPVDFANWVKDQYCFEEAFDQRKWIDSDHLSSLDSERQLQEKLIKYGMTTDELHTLYLKSK